MQRREKPPACARKSLYPHFHPSGIKEMAESRGIRIAHAVARLPDSLEAGEMEDRLVALRTLREEVLTTAEGPMPRNTARVLIEIMKDLVRLSGRDHPLFFGVFQEPLVQSPEKSRPVMAGGRVLVEEVVDEDDLEGGAHVMAQDASATIRSHRFSMDRTEKMSPSSPAKGRLKYPTATGCSSGRNRVRLR